MTPDLPGLESRDGWHALATKLVDHALPFMSQDGTRIDGPGPARDTRVDGLEGFARVFLIHALAESDRVELSATSERFIAGVEAGVRGGWPSPRDHSQVVVESASIALALWLGDARLWRALSTEAQHGLVGWLHESAVAAARTRNNWQLFAIVIGTFLEQVEHPSPARGRLVRSARAAVEAMYAGDGWYSDGGRATFDYYNAWGFHFYLPLVALLSGDERLTATMRERTGAFVGALDQLVSSDGSYVRFGRSLTYRFGAAAAWSTAAIVGAGPLPPADYRARSAAMVRYFLRSGALDADGLLLRGWGAVDLDLVQSYSGPFASYWAGKVFANLLLPQSHEYWSGKGHIDPSLMTARLAVPNFLVASDPQREVVRMSNHGSYDRIATDVRRAGDDPFYSALSYSSATAPAGGEFARASSVTADAGGRILARARIRSLGGGLDWAASRSWLRPADGQPRWLERLLRLRPLRQLPEWVGSVTAATVSRGSWDVHLVRSSSAHQLRIGGWPITEGAPAVHDGSAITLRSPRLVSRLVGLVGLSGAGLDRGVPSLRAAQHSSLVVAASFLSPADSAREAPPTAHRHGERVTIHWPDGATHDCELSRRRVTVRRSGAFVPGELLARPMIAIATFRRPALLGALLATLASELADVRAVVVVIDNDPAGSGRSVAESAPFPVRYAIEPVPGIVAARNRVLEEFTDEFDSMLFVDDDELVSPGWLRAMLEFAVSSGADVVSAPVIPVYGDAPEWMKRGHYLEHGQFPTGKRLPDAATNNTLLRRSVWLAAGSPRFDPDFSTTGGSDNDFFRRLTDRGAVVLHFADAAVFEPVDVRRTRRAWVTRRGIRYGIVKGRLWRDRRGTIYVIGRGLLTLAAGAFGTAYSLVAPHTRGKHVFRMLGGIGQVIAVFGVRVHEYRRPPEPELE